MTHSEYRVDVPLASATAHAAVSGGEAAISAGARDQCSNWQIAVTDSHGVRRGFDASAPLRAEAKRAWQALTAELDRSANGGQEVWPLVLERITMTRAWVYGQVEERNATVDRYADAYAGPLPYPSRPDRQVRRQRNRAGWWARRFAEHGGTPAKDALLTWQQIVSDAAKARRLDLWISDVWQRVLADVVAIRSMVDNRLSSGVL